MEQEPLKRLLSHVEKSRSCQDIKGQGGGFRKLKGALLVLLPPTALLSAVGKCLLERCI